MPVRRPCPTCGRLLERSERCPICPGRVDRRPSRAGHDTVYDHAWRTASVKIRKRWVAVHGWVCPGWDTQGRHPSTDLVVDHDVGVLCRRCNAVKAATFDRERAARRRA